MPLLNRHYVTYDLKNELDVLSSEFKTLYPGLKISYLDANFPFMNGFPLLPHLSHNDGRKIDLGFYYTIDGKLTNSKPSNSGYGVYVEPTSKEQNQTEICKSQRHKQYDYSKYLTLGSKNGYTFQEKATKDLLELMTRRNVTEKIFIEPHLKQRLNLTSRKIRFQGCHSVRHDDHIHYQIK